MNELEDRYGNWQAKLYREKVEAEERFGMEYVDGVRIPRMTANAMDNKFLYDTTNYRSANLASTSKRRDDDAASFSSRKR